MTYTYKQVLAYEVARELANTHIADFSAAIWDEEHKVVPDPDRVAELTAASLAVHLERDDLSMTDDDAVARFTAKYRRVPEAAPGDGEEMAFMEEALALANPTPKRMRLSRP